MDESYQSDTTQLTGQRILGLFREMDDLLEEPASILVVGGAALAVHWHEQNTRLRWTMDIDFAPLAYPDFPDQSTYKVDIVTKSMPAHFETLSSIIARGQSLDPKWLNNDVVNVMVPDVEYEPTELFRGHKLYVDRPSLRVLLAMKLVARRNAKDLPDAIQLAKETGINTYERMRLLVEDTFGEEHLDYDVDDFIYDVESTYQFLHGKERGRFTERDLGLQ